MNYFKYNVSIKLLKVIDLLTFVINLTKILEPFNIKQKNNLLSFS